MKFHKSLGLGFREANREVAQLPLDLFPQSAQATGDERGQIAPGFLDEGGGLLPEHPFDLLAQLARGDAEDLQYQVQ